MGRPLNKKYFGNRNIGSASTSSDDGIGGSRVASVTIGGSWAGFTALTTTVTFSDPQLPGGVTATGTAVINGSGAVTGVTMTEKGSGYTTAPTVTIVDSDGGAETTGTATAVLETDSGNVGAVGNNENAIVIYANTSGSGSTGKKGDIIKQVSTNRYKVKTADGTKIVQLGTDSSPEDGEAYIVATATGGTYYVTKLTAHKATLVAKTGDEALDGKSVQWTFGSPTATIVQLENA